MKTLSQLIQEKPVGYDPITGKLSYNGKYVVTAAGHDLQEVLWHVLKDCQMYEGSPTLSEWLNTFEDTVFANADKYFEVKDYRDAVAKFFGSSYAEWVACDLDN